MISNGQIVLAFTAIYAALFAVSLVFAAGGFWFFNIWGAKRWQHREIVPQRWTYAQVRKEIFRSLRSMAIFAVFGTAIYVLERTGQTNMYHNIADHGPIYWIVSFFLVQGVHDAYFYWTHRLMHVPGVFKRAHMVHHESRVPTPFAALSFHPIEASIHALFFGMMAALPIHWTVIFAFYAFMHYINMWGHTGYEFWATDLPRRPIQKILNTPTHHNLHHESMGSNFGIYYNFWDHICGTNSDDYVARYDAIKAKTNRHLASVNRKPLLKPLERTDLHA